MKQKLNSDDQLILVNYLINQNKIEYAKKVFNKIDRNEIGQTVVYDYMKAQFLVQSGKKRCESLKELCNKYSDYYNMEWRKIFLRIKIQIELILTEEKNIKN